LTLGQNYTALQLKKSSELLVKIIRTKHLAYVALQEKNRKLRTKDQKHDYFIKYFYSLGAYLHKKVNKFQPILSVHINRFRDVIFNI